MEEGMKLISQYGLEIILMALVTNLLTEFVKAPVKALAKRLNDPSRLTRFIVFVPVVIGFIVTIIEKKFILRDDIFDREFFQMWLSTSSLSLTFYAIFEKMFPQKNNALSQTEIAENQKLIAELRKALIAEEATQENAVSEVTQQEKIILKGHRDESPKTEE